MIVNNDESELSKGTELSEGIEFILGIDTSQSNQIGTKVRCAVAFGCSMVCIIGNRYYNTPGSHGSHKFISIRHFYYMKDFIDFVENRGCEVYGLSSISYPTNIIPSNEHETKLININQCNFKKSVAFIIANKSNIIDEAIDKFLYVPLQHDNFDHDINFDSKLSICMHAFTNSSGYTERNRLNCTEKFQVSNKKYHRSKHEKDADKERYKCKSIDDDSEIDDDNILTILFNE